MAFTLPKLPYGYADLAPHYDEKLLTIHHTKHHQAYTDKLNIALENAGITESNIETILKNLDDIDSSKRTAIINNGGGYYNHTFFWESLSPQGGAPSSELENALVSTFGSIENFKEEFSTKAAIHFGSGWAWLVLNENNELAITDTHDQICPLSLGHKPLLTIDVWEHAYYLQYENVRPSWIKAFWEIVNWNKVSERYQIALNK